VETNHEIWQFGLAYHPEYTHTKRCLKVSILPSKMPSETTVIEVTADREKNAILEINAHWFLFLRPPQRILRTSCGEILLDEMYKGCLYVKGSFVKRGKYQTGNKSCI
jgi:hypothetical protein